MLVSKPSWFCVQARPHAEMFAKQNLDRMGFDTLMLTEQVTRTFKGHKHERSVPLLGSYFFVRFDPINDNWRPITSAYGVRRLFSSNPETPLVVSQQAIDDLIRCSTPTPLTTTRAIDPGCMVRVKCGPMSDTGGGDPATGICTWTHGQRVKLLMTMLNGKQEIEFDIDNLELV